jgi:predicted ATPase
MIKSYILTGTAGAGKTSLIRYLETRGHFVVEEAATDIISLEQALGVAEPWTKPAFIDQIVTLQKQRQIHAGAVHAELKFFDRSPLDAYALSVYLKFPPSPLLLEEIERMESEQIYQKKVFFIQNLGFCQPTEARKISFEESLRFEKIHEEVYLKWNYECVAIAPKSILERVQEILEQVGI